MADNLTAICEPILWKKYGNLDVSKPYGPPQSATGITLPFYTPCNPYLLVDSTKSTRNSVENRQV
jgi:hypothetical protein